MYRIAIVEDDPFAAAQLRDAVYRYSSENGINLRVDMFQEGMTFLETYQPDYDLLFLDIQLPGIDGLQIAKEIRNTDTVVCICYVTNMAECAIKGYEVNARDFILKPVNYFDFNIRFRKLLKHCESIRTQSFYTIRSKKGVFITDIRDIIYVEVFSHNLIFHTRQQDYEVRGVIGQVEKELSSHNCFVRCHASYLVNCAHIQSFSDDIVALPDAKIPVGRTRRDQFVKRLNQYIASL